jgi:hypothetical protein
MAFKAITIDMVTIDTNLSYNDDVAGLKKPSITFAFLNMFVFDLNRNSMFPLGDSNPPKIGCFVRYG